jgi:hypothetical protein
MKIDVLLQMLRKTSIEMLDQFFSS